MNIKLSNNENIDLTNASGRKLAYIGDSVFELYIRTYFFDIFLDLNKTHNSVVSVVNAEFQFYLAKNIVFTDNEFDFIRRIRNQKCPIPKNVKPSFYKYSTGFEALIGKLFLENNTERLNEIMNEVIKIISERFKIEKTK